MSSRRDAAAGAAIDDPIESLLLRSRRCRQKGELRRALVLLREACARDTWRARSWTLLGALSADLGHRDEASEAFGRARWLRARAGETSRVAVLDRLTSALGLAAA